MGPYKHIETAVGRFIAGHYTRAIEVGIGKNPGAAGIVRDAGALLLCTDIRKSGDLGDLPFVQDDIFEPDFGLYEGADVIYAIRPAIEMIPPLIAIAQKVNADLVICHLGFEVYGNGGERIECGITLHRYFQRSEPVKQR